MLSAEGWQAWIDALAFLACLANFVSASFFWKMRATFVTQDHIAALEKKLEGRLMAFDDLVRSKTDGDETDDLEVRLRDVERKAETSVEIMKRVEHQVQLLVEYRIMESG